MKSNSVLIQYMLLRKYNTKVHIQKSNPLKYNIQSFPMIFHLLVISFVRFLEIGILDNELNNKEEKEEEKVEELLIQFLYIFVLLKLYITIVYFLYISLKKR